MDKNEPRLTIKDLENQELTTLGDDDVGVIIRKNLDIELLIPNRNDEETMSEAEMYGFAIMMALGDEELSKAIFDFAEKKMEEANSQEESDKNVN